MNTTWQKVTCFIHYHCIHVIPVGIEAKVLDFSLHSYAQHSVLESFQFLSTSIKFLLCLLMGSEKHKYFFKFEVQHIMTTIIYVICFGGFGLKCLSTLMEDIPSKFYNIDDVNLKNGKQMTITHTSLHVLFSKWPIMLLPHKHPFQQLEKPVNYMP